MAKAKPKKKGAQKTPLRMPTPPKKKQAPKRPAAKKPSPKKATPKPVEKPEPKPEPKPTPVAPAPPVVIEKKKQYRVIAWVPIQSLGLRQVAPGTIVEPAEWEAEILLKQEAIEEV
jgi:outer membrane biosynthesis protein TonB